MNVKEQIVAVAEKTKVLPSKSLLHVMALLTRPALNHWAAKAETAWANLQRCPKGTPEYAELNSKYNEAFGEWHRLSLLRNKLLEVEKYPVYPGVVKK